MRDQFRQLILFAYVFSFDSVLPVNSAKVVILFTLLFVLTRVLVTRRLILIWDSKLINSIFLGVLSVIAMSVVLQLLHGRMDFGLPYSFLILFVEGFLGSILIISFYYRHENLDAVFRDLINICLLQAIIIFAMLFNPEIRELFFAMQGEARADVFDRYGGFRGLGLAGSVVYDLAAIMGFAQILLALQMRQSGKVVPWAIFKWLFLLAAIAITGRTGFLCSLVSLLIMASHGDKGKLRVLSIGAAISGIVYYVLANLVTLFPQLDALAVESILLYITEVFGDGPTRSTETLWDSIKIKDVQTFLFGMGVFNWDLVSSAEYRHYSDSGYLRHILYHGFFISAISIVLYIRLWMFVLCIVRRSGLEISDVLVGIIFLSLVIQIKGDFIFSSGVNVKFSFILIAGILAHHHHFYKKRSRTLII